jgi:hypothetical protein
MGPKEDEMAKERKPETLTEEELAEANGEPLPAREAMTVIRGTDPVFPIFSPDPPTDIPLDDPHPDAT